MASAREASSFSRFREKKEKRWNMLKQDYKPVLLVEDDTVDAMAVEKAFRHLSIKNKLAHVINGEEALEYLQNSNNPIPGIIFLDLNMPKMGGIEFMKVIKADNDLKKIPIVILTTSKTEQDRIKTMMRQTI